MKAFRLLEALNEVGDDLITMAETAKFRSPWKRWGVLAASLALVLCLGALVLPYFPMGCSSSEAPEYQDAETMPEAMPEEAAPETEEAAPETEEAVPETPAEEAAPESTDQAEKTHFLFEDHWYRLTGESEQQPADLGEVLGTVETWEGRDLSGCRIYSAADSDDLYVQTEDGFCRAVPE